jgi:hypothetical protein
MRCSSPHCSLSAAPSRFAVDRAHKILAEKLGKITVEERDDGVYAQMDIGPVLLEAAGADVARTGCGGSIWTNDERWIPLTPMR